MRIDCFLLLLLVNVSCVHNAEHCPNCNKRFAHATAPNEISFDMSSLLDEIPKLSYRQYVYVVRTGCSFCIAKALDCYKAYSVTNYNYPFLFLSQEDPAIFQHYFKRQFDSDPLIYRINNENRIEEGLYTIEGNVLIAFHPWIN